MHIPQHRQAPAYACRRLILPLILVGIVIGNAPLPGQTLEQELLSTPVQQLVEEVQTTGDASRGALVLAVSLASERRDFSRCDGLK